MCINPTYIWVLRGPKYEQQPVACQRFCWRCRANYISDYVGRSLCEAEFADWTVALTLTYAPRDDGADKVITVNHFQNFMKRLRRRVTRVRYLVCGEYGERKGRAHFHVVLFGKGKRPKWPQEKNHNDHDVWPHGFLYAQWDPGERGIRYVCKYVLKDVFGANEDDGQYRQSWFSLSKKPALGHEWFMAKAERDAQLGVYPNSFHYRPPGADTKKQYLMRGATKRDYLNRVRVLQGKRPEHQLNQYVKEAFEKQDLAAWKKELEAQTPQKLFEYFVNEINRKEFENKKETLTFWNYVDTTYSGPAPTAHYRKAFKQWQKELERGGGVGIQPQQSKRSLHRIKETA